MRFSSKEQNLDRAIQTKNSEEIIQPWTSKLTAFHTIYFCEKNSAENDGNLSVSFQATGIFCQNGSL
jgi:hypothetical protein